MTSNPAITPVMGNVPPFSYEFVHRMRQSPEAKIKPSVRVTHAIPGLLSSRFFKNGRLTLDDFIDAAVFTTWPPDQKLARSIAEDIVLGRSSEKKDPEVVVIPERLVNESALHAVIQQIKHEQELAKNIKKELVQAGYDYLQKLRERQDSSLHDAATYYITDGDIVLQGISSDKELKKAASRRLLDKTGDLTSKDILNARTLDALDELLAVENAAERLAAKALRHDQDVVSQFRQLAMTDPATAARALRYMEDIKAPKKTQRQAMDTTLQQALQDLSGAGSYSAELGRVPDNLSDLVRDAATKFSLADSFQFAKQVQSGTGQDIREDLLREYDNQYYYGASNNVNAGQLAENAINSPSWKNLVDKLTSDLIQNADSRSTPAEFLTQKLREHAGLRQKMPDAATGREWDQSMQKLADAAVEGATSKTHLRQIVKSASNAGKAPTVESIRNAGERLGMNEQEIAEMLNPSFEVIKNLIQQGVSSFDRLHDLMSAAGLRHDQLQQLADLALSKGNQEALGAVAHIDLHAALGTSSTRMGYRGRGMGQGLPSAYQPDQARLDKVMGGLLGGPAANIVRIWFAYRDELPDEVKTRLRENAKRLLINLGERFARQTMGTSMLGGLQESSTIRPFRIGDETDLIDLEETIDSLLSQGRTNLQNLNPEDFLINETHQGHRAFFWALDKSGSMDSAEKLGMLAIAVMAGVFAVQRDDFGVVLFDSETYVVKQMDDKRVTTDKVAADLLDVRAGGGTGARAALALALTYFKQTRAKERILVLNTDMYLSDLETCQELAGDIKQQDIKLIVIVPETSYNSQGADSLAKAGHGVVLHIGSIEELPEKLLRVTNY